MASSSQMGGSAQNGSARANPLATLLRKAPRFARRGTRRLRRWSIPRGHSLLQTISYTSSPDSARRGLRALPGSINDSLAITTNAHHRFVYDGYLCIQRLDATANNLVELSFAWDPTEPVATRPLVMQRNGGWNFFYTHDGNKNVSDVVSFQQARGVPAHYEYAPFGAVTAVVTNNTITAFNVAATNPFRFSSEYADDTLGLVYYNYRHYDSMMGRWLNRDMIEEIGGFNIYSFCLNRVFLSDALGRKITYHSYRYGEPKKKAKDTRDRDHSKKTEKCVLVVTIDWFLKYPKHWDQPRQEEWELEAVNTVQDYFNSNNLKKKCIPKSGCCICKDGVSVKVLINVFKEHKSGAQEFVITVEETDNGSSWTDPAAHRGKFVSYGNELRQNRTGNRQKQVVHEVGHQLGLHHPGGKSNDLSAYMADPPSLMGGGMEMRPADFDSAFCSKIKAEELSRRDAPKCRTWSCGEVQ